MKYGKQATLILAMIGMLVAAANSASFSAAVIFRDSTAGFSITLPAGWQDSSLSPDSRIFRDPANVYHAIVGVVRYDYDTTLYTSEKDWCISMSTAYEISVESDPFFGFIYACDSTLQDGLFAMYANAEYGMPIRSETIRWTAINRRGYELYVFTDTLDMYSNFGLYKSFLDSVHIFSKTNVVAMPAGRPMSAPCLNAFKISVRGGLPPTIPGFQGRLVIVNSAGREIGAVTYNNGMPIGVPSFKAPNKKSVQIIFGLKK